jgi:hypothetical protein
MHCVRARTVRPPVIVGTPTRAATFVYFCARRCGAAGRAFIIAKQSGAVAVCPDPALFPSMSASPQPALDAILAELATAVASYEQDVEALLAAWPDMERYRTVSDGIDAIRRHAAAVPPVSVAFVALLIAHTELIHALWQQTNDGRAGNARHVQQAREQHAQCAAGLRRQCRGLLRAGLASASED